MYHNDSHVISKIEIVGGRNREKWAKESFGGKQQRLRRRRRRRHSAGRRHFLTCLVSVAEGNAASRVAPLLAVAMPRVRQEKRKRKRRAARAGPAEGRGRGRVTNEMSIEIDS